MHIIPITDFDLASSAHSGGKTGSRRVKDKHGSHYQLKSPVKHAPALRRIKSSGLDIANIGEVLASRILSPATAGGVPLVFVVYDKDRGDISIASKYIEGAQVQTLDDYLRSRGLMIPAGTHAKLVDPRKGEELKPGEYALTGEADAHLKSQIALAIATSAIAGDHDCNPGNLMVITGSSDKEVRVARIDFGHAFLDLTTSLSLFGGGITDPDRNLIRDFFNRSTVAGMPSKNQSKFWRDYPGLMPSAELAAALLELAANDKGLTQGISETKQYFADLFRLLEAEGDHKNIKHLRTTLAAIANNVAPNSITGDVLKNKDSTAFLDRVFTTIEAFVLKNQRDMLEVVKIMQLQGDIDNMLAESGNRFTGYIPPAITSQYHELVERYGKNSKLLWLKTAAEYDPIKGSLIDYSIARAKQLLEITSRTTVAPPPKPIIPEYKAIRSGGHATLAHNNIYSLPPRPTIFRDNGIIIAPDNLRILNLIYQLLKDIAAQNPDSALTKCKFTAVKDLYTRLIRPYDADLDASEDSSSPNRYLEILNEWYTDTSTSEIIRTHRATDIITRLFNWLFSAITKTETVIIQCEKELVETTRKPK